MNPSDTIFTSKVLIKCHELRNDCVSETNFILKFYYKNLYTGFCRKLLEQNIASHVSNWSQKKEAFWGLLKIFGEEGLSNTICYSERHCRNFQKK